jgi:hypothetical protein
MLQFTTGTYILAALTLPPLSTEKSLKMSSGTKKTLTVKRLVNNSVAQSPSKEDDSRTANQETPHLLNKLKIHCHLENTLH